MKTYGLIGKSLAHSFSSDYFKKKFAYKEIDAEYKNFEFENVEAIRPFFDSLEISGLNVTIPYKQAIIPFLDEVDVVAQEIGAVNCIVIDKGKWIGYNTDYYGFMTSLKPFIENKHNRALVLGTGGASLAIQYALKQMDIPFHLVSREKGKSELTYEELNERVIEACKFIINTTPLGSYPNLGECPALPYDAVGSDHLLYDLVYNPAKTKFLQHAENNKAMFMNGLDMLKHQAEKAWLHWSA